MKDLILLCRWSIEELDHIIRDSSNLKDAGARIEFLSRQFLGIPYKDSTLIGDIDTPEVFVINLEGVDCLTLIEYVEAMRRSCSFPEFAENLKRVRYRRGIVSFVRRNHFFTDWAESGGDTSHIFATKIWEVSPPDALEFIEDVTFRIGGSGTIRVRKRLNLRGNGTSILPGIPYKDREIHYIPASAVDQTVMERLKTGDYAGIYSGEDGLDVSHVGIIIKTGDGIYLRHASSRSYQRKVIDEEFRDYIAGKPGLVVLRPKPVICHPETSSG